VAQDVGMIETVIETWHGFVAGTQTVGLSDLLADDVVFYSPIVFTPQRGKDITTMYLTAAKQTLFRDGSDFR
jgi:ketosteroid isomerase-like protein